MVIVVLFIVMLESFGDSCAVYSDARVHSYTSCAFFSFNYYKMFTVLTRQVMCVCVPYHLGDKFKYHMPSTFYRISSVFVMSLSLMSMICLCCPDEHGSGLQLYSL